MKFTDLNLIEPLLQAVHQKGYTEPSPIQEQSIPHLLQRRDLFGCAQTGTGKTAAFALPILQLMHGEGDHAKAPYVHALILAPTRELALQINESFDAYGKNLGLRNAVIFGGVSQVPQEAAMKKGVDILVATPGRLLDLMQQGLVRLDRVRYFVLDEADRMLDMGFIHDIRKILPKLPERKQTFFFSATVPDEIRSMAGNLLKDPVRVNVTPVSTPAETVRQFVYHVPKEQKRSLLRRVIEEEEIGHVLVFTRTKRGADRVARDLTKAGIKAESIHGDKSQTARQRALQGFKDRKVRVLVATDIAARGIDVQQLSHVINFEIPEVAETYVHRIGRTGRAGANGVAFTFCSPDEADYLRDIQKLIRKPLEVLRTPELPDAPPPAPPREAPPTSPAPRGRNDRNRGRRPRPGSRSRGN
ncbi:MAG: DEAD/DEAH box helicase [Bacteroidota bacterium]